MAIGKTTTDWYAVGVLRSIPSLLAQLFFTAPFCSSIRKPDLEER